MYESVDLQTGGEVRETVTLTRQTARAHFEQWSREGVRKGKREERERAREGEEERGREAD